MNRRASARRARWRWPHANHHVSRQREGHTDIGLGGDGDHLFARDLMERGEDEFEKRGQSHIGARGEIMSDTHGDDECVAVGDVFVRWGRARFFKWRTRKIEGLDLERIWKGRALGIIAGRVSKG